MIEHSADGVPAAVRLRTADGLDLFVRRNQRVDAPRAVVLVLHGLGTYGEYYDELVGPVTDLGCSIVRYDRRGHGYSGGERHELPPVATDLADLLLVVEWIKQQHDGAPIYGYGESYGGALLVMFAAAHPQALDGLILTAPMVRPCVNLGNLVELVRRAPILLGSLVSRGVSANPLPYRTLSHDPFFVERFRTDSRINHEMTPNALSSIFHLVRHLLSTARRVNLPVLIVQGDDDQWVSPSGARDLRDALREGGGHIRLQSFTGGYHLLLHDDGEALLIESVVSWLKDQLPAPGSDRSAGG